jgi:hydroxymethylpyrimidine kinase/phosphomethylpyrimidine kinase/thiamine-phosphate diphosphorylase
LLPPVNKCLFSPQGQDRLQQWVELLADHYPLVAIGGIDLPRAKQLKQTGVGSVAMITAITKAEDYKKATQDLLACWTETDS